ncbi:Endosome/lysosome-associated apoptosis and autophagy regulator member 2 [Xenoophorus captivus]|uniref:Endosome/lysosome-associated apoptosis and autophagy regulator member 2 n=1 Tax=Xenoophorus captivus TaxID=1517983 RepID=A0ABV0QW33_9TELE
MLPVLKDLSFFCDSVAAMFASRLEYKYSRLVMSANKECELPAADSCGLAEGEEAEDDVVYTQKPTLLGKLRAIANKHEDGESSESVQLNSSQANRWVLG